MAPTAQEIKVATDSLRTDSKTWAAQSDAMDGLKTKISGLEFGRIEAGLFQGIVDAHTKLVNKLSTLCGEAGAKFDEVASTVQLCADTYDAEDAAQKHRIDNLW
ncbi:hypothetical protein ACWDYH_15385 [Nocardia goodfellowii]